MSLFNLPYDNTKVTVELRELVENGVDVWAFDYPSYYKDEAKKAFEQKVLDHYWFRQIGQETPGRWLHCFRSRIRDIMPYYIQLYQSEKFMQEIEDPFATVDYTETYEEEHSGESTSTSTAENSGTTSGTDTRESIRKRSDTPQGSISNLDQYLTEANVDNDTTTTNGETSATSTGEATDTTSGTVRHTLTKKGAMGVTTFGHDMIEYRQSFLNIDLMIINELKDLFLQVY